MEKTTSPLLSVVMCVYNGEKYLDEAIRSILNQTVSDYEFIIINDGSTDSTEKIILSYNDPRIRYVKNEQNLKLIKSSNKGIDLANGKYLARMDADDISLPDRFEKQLAIFNLYPEVCVVNARAYILTEDGTRYREQKWDTTTYGFEAMRFVNNLQNHIFNPVVMVKTAALKQYKYIDDVSRLHIEDFDLWTRMLRDGCICYTLEDKLILYRDNSQSINHKYKNEQIARMSLVCKELLATDFGFQMDPASLQLMLAEGGTVNYSILKKLDSDLLSYNSMIKKSRSISEFGQAQMEIWRKQKEILVSLKSFSSSNLKGKIGITAFLLSHIGWFSNKNIRTLMRRSFFTKWQNNIPKN